MSCDVYKRGLHQIWQRGVSHLWLAVCVYIILTAQLVSTELARDIDHPDVRSSYMMRYMVPRDFNDSDMYTKALTNLNWQHFTKNELSLSNEDDMLSKTIIDSLVMILEEPVTLLNPKNTTFYYETKPLIRLISQITNSILPTTIQRHKLTQYPNDIRHEGGVKLLSRGSLFERQNHLAQDADIKTGQSMVPIAISTSKHGNADVCESCQMREQVKLKSLESIKNIILKRLQLQRLPNITKPIVVPHSIIDKFYKKYNGAMTDNGAGNSMNYKLQNADLNGPQYMKIATMHRAHYQYAQQGLFDKQNTQGKYQTIHSSSRSKSSLGSSHTPIRSNDKYGKLFEPTNQEQNDDDVQNDGLHLLYYDQQMLNINKHKEPMNFQQEQLFLSNKDDVLPQESLGTYDYMRDIDDESLSHVNSIYIFPTATRVRHNRRWDVINFNFDHSHLTIVRTVIHLYIHGRDWMRKHYPEILEQKVVDGRTMRRRDLIIMIHHVARRPHYQNLTHTLKLVESRHRIPAGLGEWVQFEVKHKVPIWLNQNYVTMTLAIKTREAWMRPFLAIDTEDTQNKQFPLHIEAFIKQPRRRKRSTSLDCHESDHEVRCCRYPLKVNFTNFGWNFVVAPTSFDAFFCNGECKVGYLEQYTHTHIASLTTSATPCCSPTKMNPLSLLYFDQDHNLVLSTIPNMSVEKCSCS
ncbi:uncharacterized protein LOC105218267 isoform X2 [Zeugodacus cucurbitae]|nr:uncharacterized protein LOC105218267 isoform X2 [Zeugodacus cucurbitae]XP_011192021.1 uncharacterized protein LOC105218267 isoform X2 [Zeugodacus cucurbitae]XP_011192022.1 uncharacterized protein LOC105218267 isoform X2 [Zeugodacus cucurbitae]XP_028899932.1 uncharacterized protein LOC105218267 isoform X2 [Zeugodacus cucurbitae]